MLKEKTDSKKILIVKELTSFGDPLDFSYKSLVELSEILREIPRKGKRRPPVIEDNKKDDKKRKDGLDDGSGGRDGGSTENREGDGDIIEKHEGEKLEGEEQQQEKPKEKEDKNKPIEINLIPETHINNLINQHHVSLAAVTKNITGKVIDENKVLQTKQAKINLVTTGLLISYNEIRDLLNLKKIVDTVMYNPDKLSWIDVSHNYLQNITKEFQHFPNLTTLNYHCNFVNELSELENLEPCENLHNLTIHGNPLDTIPGFRLYIVGILPQLKKLDTVLITKKEKDNAKVWRDAFGHGRTRKYPKVKNPIYPPEKEKPKQTEQLE